ncbi:MAG: DUF6350 family protein [Candidatus Nanopelagicales bacterium]
MTSMLERPAESEAAAPRARRPLRTRADVVATRPVAAVIAALWAAGVGLLVIGVVLSLAWAVSSRGDDGLTTPLRATGTLWLVAHHAPVTAGAVTITLLPLLLMALPLVLLARAGRWAARITSTTTVPDAAIVVVTGAATYVVAAFLVSDVSGVGDAVSPAVPVIAWSAVLAVLGLGYGVAEGAGLLPRLHDALPVLVRRALVAAAAAGSALVALVGIVATAAIVLRWSTVTGLAHGVAPAASDAVGLFLLSLVYLPNLLVWTLSYVAGPGFSVGAGVDVGPFSPGSGLLPGAPLLGAIPADPPAAAPLLLLLPVLAGAIGALVVRRRGSLTLVDEALVVLGASLLVGVGAGLLSWLASGSLGAARLAGLGPAAVPVALATTGLVLAGALLVTLLAHALPRIWVREPSA